MAKKMLIVHGYSDGSGSFKELGEFFIEHGGYKKEDVCYADYASMDDEATFRDFADKLDDDYDNYFSGERVDVACHSTGSLVVRAWLAMRFERHQRRGQPLTCPVRHLLMFAPANFGSDLARMGQSFLGKARTTFFNSHSFREDALESGKQVLEGLEPASPFQWELSDYDLHGKGSGFFDPARPAAERCYPFVLAAGESYGGLQARIIKKRKKPGTDGTVRICGTSLNTRKFTIDFREHSTAFVQWSNKRFATIPFAVFAGFNHGSIVHPFKSKARTDRFLAANGPGTLALEALGVNSKSAYEAAATRFARARTANYKAMPATKQKRYQQIFFRVYDDVDREVDDFYADFFVVDGNGDLHEELTRIWDRKFESTFYRHSAQHSCRIMMLNLSELRPFVRRLRQQRAKLVLEVTGQSPIPNVSYQKGRFEVYDGTKPPPDEQESFIHPNTTTLVRAVLNRKQADKLMNVKFGL